MNWKTGVVALFFTTFVTTISAGALQVQSGAPDDTSNLRAPQNDWITLRLKLRAGDTFRITDRTRGKSVEVTPETEDHYSAKVETVTETTQVSEHRVLYLHADGAAQLRVTYGDYQKRTVIDGKRQKITAPRNPWRGVQIEMKIAPDGRISNVRGGDKIWRAVVADYDDFTAAQKQEMEQYLKKAFGDDSIKHIFEQAGMSYPQKPVRIGQLWFQRVQIKGLASLTMNLRRSVVSRANGVLNIRDKGTLSFDDKTPFEIEDDDGGVDDDKMQIKMSGTFAGNTQIDETSGFTRAAFYTTRIGGTTTDLAAKPPSVTRDYSLVTTRLSVQKLR